VELTVIILFLAAGVSLTIPSKASHLKGWLLALFPLGIFIYLLMLIPVIDQQGSLEFFWPWMTSIGFNIHFILDGLSLIFALLITGIGAFILIYAHDYMKEYSHTKRFYFYLLVFMGSMLGLVLSANLLLLFVFWELTGISSFMLIGFKHQYENVRKAALQALLITGFGGLMMLAGFVLLGIMGGTYDIQALVAQNASLVEHSWYLPALILILGGAFSKSAQFPFHFWLPGAMQAPSPVSAFLHSATMVKAGVYLLARLHPALGDTVEWHTIIPLFGGATMLIGAYLALTQKDLKAILAYTTVSSLGMLILLIGIGTQLSMKAALIYLIVHAFYKGSLFMVAGSIEQATGTRDIDQLGNLARKMPLITIVAILSLLSMAGLPPMLGFISKEVIYEAKIQAPGIAGYVTFFGVVANIFMVWVSLFVAYRVFFRKKYYGISPIKKSSANFWIGPGMLALAGLILGLFPYQLGEKIIQPALAHITAENPKVELKLWHGFNKVFMLSLLTILSGVGLFLLRNRIIPVIRKINRKAFNYSLSDIFSGFLEGIMKISKMNTELFQHGYHRFYLMVMFISIALLGWYQLFQLRFWEMVMITQDVSLSVLLIAVIMLIATLFTLISQSRLTAIISMGVVGYGVAIIYFIYSGIDLAITQLLVETLTMVIFVMVVFKLPQFAKLSSRRSKIRDAVIALAVGGFMTGVSLQASNLDLKSPISNYFIENSASQAFGKNIVNVILVDFRALDTLGEITVLLIATLGIVALLKMKRS